MGASFLLCLAFPQERSILSRIESVGHCSPPVGGCFGKVPVGRCELPAGALSQGASGRDPLKAMTESWGKLRIDVVDDEIIVSLPGTSYSVTYFKPPNSPQLLAKNISQSDDKRTPLRLSDFLCRAWQAANATARELGWIA